MKLFRSLLALVFLVSVVCLPAQQAVADSFLYSDYEILLKLCVRDGLVDREALVENKHYLYTFLTNVHLLEKSTYETWTRPEKFAFWINVYNACALTFIVRYSFAEKLTDIPDDPKTKLFSVFGERLSLSDMKHMYLRGYIKDERLHFAIVTPAKGFPRLRNESYLGVHINLQLEEAVMQFVKDPQNVLINEKEKSIILSPFFEWAAIDFALRYKNDVPELRKYKIRERAVLKFLSAYFPEHADFILEGKYAVTYNDFNWDLNVLATEEKV